MTARLNPTKKSILEALWRNGKPVKPLEIARQLGLSRPQAMMHLLGLKNLGYVSSPERNHYVITEQGREVIGLSKITQDTASQILRPIPREGAFYFYNGVGQYSGVSADSLQDFCDKIQKVNVKAIEFHLLRNDFEHWLQYLGDTELAKKMALIRDQGLTGEELQKKVYETTKYRCEELTKLTAPLTRSKYS